MFGYAESEHPRLSNREIIFEEFPPVWSQSTNVTEGGAVVYWLARSTSGREVVGSSPLAAGCRLATVGQLLFAPWAWAYSTLHPLGVGKWVPAIAGKV